MFEQVQRSPAQDLTLRDRIVAVAVELFSKRGYQRTTIQHIINAANCSKGGFYHHFATKEDVLFLIHETFFTRGLAELEAACGQPGSATERLRRVVLMMLERMELDLPYVTVFLNDRRFLSPENLSMVRKQRDGYEDAIRALVTEGIASGEFRDDLDTRIVTFAIFGVCNWTYQWLRPGGRLSAVQIGETFYSLILHGLQPQRSHTDLGQRQSSDMRDFVSLPGASTTS